MRIVATQLRHIVALGEAPARDVVVCDEHRALARRAAARACVLLRNERVGDLAVLPLDEKILRRIAVIGRLATKPNLGDPGSSNVHPPSAVTILDGLRAALPGVELVDDPALADAAIVVVGYRAVDEGESMFATDDASLQVLPWPLRSRLVGHALRWLVGRFQARGKLYGGDRAHLALRAGDEALIARVAAANPRTIVVVIAGSAVEMEAWRKIAPAIVLAWYPGMEGGHAIADVLLGRVEPGGRLPFVMAADPEHLPHFDRDARKIRYERWHGYKQLERDQHAPAFPFGFGLGYTTMTLADLRVDLNAHTATVRVANTGSRSGSTVVQLYALREGEPRELVGFTRVELAAGEASAVSIAWRGRDADRFEAAQWAGDPAAARD
jgi:beta-glucosidase